MNSIIVSASFNSEIGVKNTKMKLVSFDHIINLISGCNSEIVETISKYRKLLSDGVDKKKISSLKLNLPYFNMGEFKNNKRNNASFIKTKYFLFDLDNVENLIKLKSIITAKKNVFCCFVSPGGNGLKVIFKLNRVIDSIDDYHKYYESFGMMLQEEYETKIDLQLDPSRACTISYDQYIYVNHDSEVIDLDKIDIVENNKSPNNTANLSEVSDKYLNILSGVKEGKRRSSTLSLIGLYRNQGFDANYTLKHLLIWNKENDPPLETEEIEEVVTDIYNRPFVKKEKPNKQKPDLFIDFVNLNATAQKDEIELEKYIEFLTRNNFYLLQNEKSDQLIKIENGLVYPYTFQKLKDFFKKSVSNKKVKRKIISNHRKLFNKEILEFLSLYPGKIGNDTREKVYIYYRNCFVVVSKDTIDIKKDYKQLPNPIWYSEQIERDYKLLDDDKFLMSEYLQFLNNACGSEENVHSVLTAFGYLLHKFNNPALKKAIILVDGKVQGMSDETNGRSGKTLIAKTLSHYTKNFGEIRGDAENLRSKFRNDGLALDTRIALLQETHKNFDIQRLFDDITEGFTIEKKGQQPFKNDNVKLVVTTNFVIKQKGSSYRNRIHLIELTSHYNDKHTPEDEFGHLLFHEWTTEEWLKFDNLILASIQLYLQEGLMPCNIANHKIREFIENTSPEFYKFVCELESDVEYSKHKLPSMYMDMFSEDLTSNQITTWLNKYLKLLGWSCKKVPGTNNINNRIVIRKS